MPVLGVIMLDTRFPRPPGDIGNPASFACPVRYLTVPAATAARVVRDGAPDGSLLAPFLAARDRLVAEGCDLVTTSCGFLAPFQASLQAGCPVPVRSSALLLLAEMDAALTGDGRRAGVVTVHGGRLGPAHLDAVGARRDTPVAGVEAGEHLARVLLEDRPELDVAAAARDVVAAGRRLCSAHADLGALVLECTNMPPYREAVASATGLPVVDVLDLVERTPGFSGSVRRPG